MGCTSGSANSSISFGPGGVDVEEEADVSREDIGGIS